MSDSVLLDVLRELNVGQAEGLAIAIEQELHKRGYWVSENEFVRRAREREETAAERKTARAAAFARAIPYSGAITKCQASHMPGRGAPYRCFRAAKYITTTRRWQQDVTPIVVCGPDAHDPDVFPYNGWGGDPHPNIGTIEPEWVDRVLKASIERGLAVNDARIEASRG